MALVAAELDWDSETREDEHTMRKNKSMFRHNLRFECSVFKYLVGDCIRTADELESMP